MGSSVDNENESLSLDKFADMTLHAQELNFEELVSKMDPLLLDDSETTVIDPIQSKKPLIQEKLDSIDYDDILPSESFSTRASPTTSLVDGVIHKKPPISIFKAKEIPSGTKQESQIAQSQSVLPSDRTKDDKPARFSDIENSPPLKAAGFQGDEIPTVDPLDSDGEWGPIPTHKNLPTNFALSQLGDAQRDDAGAESREIVEETKKKKRRKKKSKGVKGAKALEDTNNSADQITGFEEFYADPPLNPDEAIEEEAMYSPNLSVAIRAEKVVQRYRAARRFNNDRERIFSAYLTFGGVRTGQKQFQGLDPKMSGTAEDFAAATAKDTVEERVVNENEVDFVWVIRGFLSYYFPTNHGWKGESDIALACEVLANFLNYIEIHNAFPEYAENITDAKDLVRKAASELILNRKCSNALPGEFNRACSTYFGGHYQGLYSGSSDEEYEFRFTTRKSMTFLRRAKGQAFLAERKIGEWSFPCEVISIDSTSMVIKQWIPEGGEEDFVEPEHKDTLIQITLESEILEFVYVGMHIEGTWHQLTNGMWYMDQITNVLPTFALEVPDEEIPDEDPEIC